MLNCFSPISVVKESSLLTIIPFRAQLVTKDSNYASLVGFHDELKKEYEDIRQRVGMALASQNLVVIIMNG